MADFSIENGVLIKYHGPGGEVTIPTGVQEIGEESFKGCTDLTSIRIPPKSVWRIRASAFEGCVNLTAVDISNGVTRIGKSAFEGCVNLTSINIAQSVWQIGIDAFKGCVNLKSIALPYGVLEIGLNTFAGCSGLTSVDIPDGVKKIEAGAFKNCKNLKSITLPNSVKKIGWGSFENCESITSFSIPDGVEEIERGTFVGCTSLTSITVPNSVQKIAGDAFGDCPRLTIVCCEGSSAYQFSIDHHLPFLFDYQFNAFGGTIPPGIEKLASPFHADEEQPYVFISYSHRDREPVLNVIKTLYESGWRIWYDEGLTIGDRYDQTIEEHVENCAAFLLFVTEHTLASQYIRNHEIPWAIKYHKPIVECLMDADSSCEIPDASVFSTVPHTQIESALEEIDGLSKGPRREAKGVSVVFNPADRTDHNGSIREEIDSFAYCMYANESAARAKTILLELKNSGCRLVDAAVNGDSRKMLRQSACLIVFLDKAFLSSTSLTQTLTEEFRAGRDIAVCQLDEIRQCDLPDGLAELYHRHWLVFTHGYSKDLYTQLTLYLQKKGCASTSVLPGFEYAQTDESIVIKRYTGMDSQPRIDGSDRIPVVEIARGAFQNCIHVKKVVIPVGMKRIGWGAFEGCVNMNSICIPNSVSRIEPDTFAGCTSLTTVTIPESITAIEDRSFRSCRSLHSIVIPDSVTGIGDRAFENCTGLESVTIADGVTRIGGLAFKNCTCLKSIVIPDSVEVIGKDAFKNCTALTSIRIPDALTDSFVNLFSDSAYYRNESNWEDGALYFGTILVKARHTVVGSFSIKPGTNMIAQKAFYGCNLLTSITIPDGVTTIETMAFCECTNLRSVVIGNGITRISPFTFADCTNLCKISLPESVRSIEMYAFAYCAKLASFTIPTGVIEIGEGAFKSCIELEHVALPYGLTEIGVEAFCNCKKLNNVTLPGSVTAIDDGAFEQCDNLTSITVPDTVNYIDEDAFLGCKNLVMICSVDSYPWKYCEINGIPAVAIAAEDETPDQ